MVRKLQKILYIDDDPNLLFLLKNAVERSHPDIHIAVENDLSSAKHNLINQDFDLLIADYMMVVDQVRIVIECGKPFILISGLSKSDMRGDLAESAIGLIEKPFSRKDIGREILETWDLYQKA